MSLSNSKLLSNNIFSNLLFASLYIATFAYVWKTYCVPVWHAYFYYDVPHSEFYEAIGYLVALVPSKLRVRKVSLLLPAAIENLA